MTSKSTTKARRLARAPSVASEKLVLTGRDIARELNIDVARACRAIANGDIPSIKLGSRRVVARAVLDKIKAGEFQTNPLRAKAAGGPEAA
jgi:hypothetical protein